MSSLNVRVLLLIRDPRGTMQSRKHRLQQIDLFMDMDNLDKMDYLPNSRIWCPGNPDCDDPKMLCQDLVDDYQAFQVIIRVCVLYIKDFLL